MGDAAGMEGSSLAKIFVGGLDRSVDEVILWFTCSLFQENSLWREEQKIYAQINIFLARTRAIRLTITFLYFNRVLYVISSVNLDPYLR